MDILARLQSNVRIGPADYEDLSRCVEICNKAWKGVFRASQQMLRRRMEAFPQGGMVVAKVNGRVEGYISVQQIHSPDVSGTWDSATDSGRLTGSHQADGDWVMGIGLAVSIAGSRHAVARHLMLYIAQYIVKNRKKGVVLVSRLSGYRHYRDRLGPEAYATWRRDGRPVDPSLRFFSRYGFAVSENPTIIVNYVDGGGDPNSCGHSVRIVKDNPHAWLPRPLAYLMSKWFVLAGHVEGLRVRRLRTEVRRRCRDWGQRHGGRPCPAGCTGGAAG